MTFGWYIFHVILYQLFNVSNLSLYNQARNWVAFQYSSVVSQSPSDHTTSGLYLLTISYSSGIVFVCKIKAQNFTKTLQWEWSKICIFFFLKHQKCEEKYSKSIECKFFLFQRCSTYFVHIFEAKIPISFLTLTNSCVV